MRLCRKVVRRGQPTVEMLEGRKLLSIVVAANGPTLYVYGDDYRQNVDIWEEQTGTTRVTRVTVDATGNGSLTDPADVVARPFTGITSIIVRLVGSDDRLKIGFADPMVGTTINYDIKTGGGNDTVEFANVVGNDIRNSTINLSVDTQWGYDRMTLSFNDINNSNIRANLYGGDGNDTLNVNVGSDITASTITIFSMMGAGNDTVLERFDWEGMDMYGSTSALRMTVSGGEGDDVLEASGQLGGSNAIVEGTLDTRFYGENGNDRINIAMDRFALRSGKLIIRGDGGAGTDSVAFSGNIETTTAGGYINAALRGGSGNDSFSVNTNIAATIQYADGALLIDGGTGIDLASVLGNVLVQKLNVEG